jgi:hypothetical protein
MKKWAILISVLALLAIAGGLLAHFYFVSPSVSAQGKPIGANVSVMGNNAPANIKAVATPTRSPFAMEPLGSTVDITPAGQIHGSPVTLRFKLNRRVTNQEVLLAVRETANDSWTLMKPVVSADGWYASVTTDHLSTWQPLLYDLNQAVQDFRKFFLDGLSGDLLTVAEKPVCANESQARQDGYTIASSAKVTLYWCFGVEGGNRVLKIANRMRYPLEVKHPGLTVQHEAGFSLDFDQLARLGSGQTTILYPFEEVDYTLNLSPGSQAGLFTSYSGYAQSLYQLEMGVSTLRDILTFFGTESGGLEDLFTSEGLKATMKILDSLLDVKDCLNAMFPPDPGKVISGCFSPAEVMDAFGWKGLLLAPIMALGSIIEFFISEASSIIDILKDTPSYAVVVSRSKTQAVLATYVGQWHVHGYDLTITSDGTGSSTAQIGPCTMSSSDWDMCQEHDTVRFTVESDGSLLATLVSLQYTYANSQTGASGIYQGQPAGANPVQVGNTEFKLVHQGDHLLYQTWADNGTNYLCDPYAAEAGWGQCGA